MSPFKLLKRLVLLVLVLAVVLAALLGQLTVALAEHPVSLSGGFPLILPKSALIIGLGRRPAAPRVGCTWERRSAGAFSGPVVHYRGLVFGSFGSKQEKTPHSRCGDGRPLEPEHMWSLSLG